MGRFAEVYRRSLDQPEAFGAEAAAAIDWIEPWQRVLDDSRAPLYRWFTGGRLNTCHNALDRHVQGGRGDQPALVYDSPVTETVAASPSSKRCAGRISRGLSRSGSTGAITATGRRRRG